MYAVTKWIDSFPKRSIPPILVGNHFFIYCKEESTVAAIVFAQYFTPILSSHPLKN